MNTELIDVVVVRRQDQAEGVAVFDLARADGGALPAFEAGAHIDVHVGGDLIRQYSLCNPPGETARYRIGVLDDPASRGGSRAIHHRFGRAPASPSRRRATTSPWMARPRIPCSSAVASASRR